MDTQLNINNVYVAVGGVPLKDGDYLLNGADCAVSSLADQSTGYVHLSGDVLTMHNYKYNGSGLFLSQKSIGIYTKLPYLTIKPEGENVIAVDGIEQGTGLYIEAGCTVKMLGKDSLSLIVQNGKCGNIGISGDGTF